MQCMEIHFLGGATTVTGSQHLLITARARILIDCGMFQGSPNESIRNRIPLDYEPSELDAMLLTHAHLDHCGLLPVLGREGYTGPIHATAGTVELATVVLLDSGHLHEEFAKRDARWEKRHPELVAADDRKHSMPTGLRWTWPRMARTASSVGRPSPASTSRRRSNRSPDPAPLTHGHAIPRRTCAPSPRPWTSISMRRCTPSRTRKRSSPVRAHRVRGGARSRAGRACHVPGCRPHPGVRDHPGPGRDTGGEAERDDHRSPAMSGRPGTPRSCAIRPSMTGADYVLVESTYGGREHEPRSEASGCSPRRSGCRGGGGRGAARCPSFAIGRTQEIVWELDRLIDARRDPDCCRSISTHRWPPGVRHLPPPPGVLRRGDAQAPGDGEIAARLPEPDRSRASSRSRQAIAKAPRPYMIVASNGMLTGGRVVGTCAISSTTRRRRSCSSATRARARSVRTSRPAPRRSSLDGQVRRSAASQVDQRLLRPCRRDRAPRLDRQLRAGRQPGDPGYPRTVFLVHGDPEAQVALEPKVPRSRLRRPTSRTGRNESRSTDPPHGIGAGPTAKTSPSQRSITGAVARLVGGSGPLRLCDATKPEHP